MRKIARRRRRPGSGQIGSVDSEICGRYSAARSESLAASGMEAIAATNGGYRIAFVAGAMVAAIAAILAATFLRPGKAGAGQGEAMAVHA